MARQRMKVKFQATLDNEPHFFEANVQVDYNVDKNYGADADGGRGIEKLFIDNVEIEGLMDEQGNLVTPTEELTDAVWEAVWENIVV